MGVAILFTRFANAIESRQLQSTEIFAWCASNLERLVDAGTDAQGTDIGQRFAAGSGGTRCGAALDRHGTHPETATTDRKIHAVAGRVVDAAAWQAHHRVVIRRPQLNRIALRLRRRGGKRQEDAKDQGGASSKGLHDFQSESGLRKRDQRIHNLLSTTKTSKPCTSPIWARWINPPDHDLRFDADPQ